MDIVATLVLFSMLPLNSLGMKRFTPAETAASMNPFRVSTVFCAIRSTTTSWPLKTSAREDGVKSLVSFLTPDANSDLEVGRLSTETLKVPALRSAEMIDGPRVPAP
jgi:hypothetical protein